MKHGDLRVWWIPQIPGKPFRVPVVSLVEGRRLLNVLADYDNFQFKHRIKGDYANAGGLEVFDSADHEDGPAGSWVEWYHGETGEDIDAFTEDELAGMLAAP